MYLFKCYVTYKVSYSFRNINTDNCYKNITKDSINHFLKYSFGPIVTKLNLRWIKTQILYLNLTFLLYLNLIYRVENTYSHLFPSIKDHIRDKKITFTINLSDFNPLIILIFEVFNVQVQWINLSRISCILNFEIIWIIKDLRVPF